MIRWLGRFEPARYLKVGALIAVINNILLIVGDLTGIGYAGLLLLTWIVGGSLGYLLHSSYTFSISPSYLAYGRFMGGVALGIPLSFAVLAGFKSGLGLPMWIAAPAATIVMIVYNYLSARLAIVWKRRFAHR